MRIKIITSLLLIVISSLSIELRCNSLTGELHDELCIQDYLSSIISLIEQGEYADSYAKIKEANDIYIIAEDSVKSDVLYLKGLTLLGMGQPQEAMSNFEKSCSFAENSCYYTTSYLDASLRLIIYNNANNNWRQSALLCNKVSKLNKKILAKYTYCSHIFLQWSIALIHLNRLHEVISVCNEGRKYADYEDSDYFFLSYYAATSLNEMGQYESAQQILNSMIVRGIKSQDEQIIGIDGLQKALKYQRIQTDSFINSLTSGYIANSILRDYNNYCESVRNLMDCHVNFGIFSLEEEKELFYSLLFLQSANTIGNLSIETKYDNILYSKNFINWKLSKDYQTKCNWKDVQKMLDKDEIAIELSASTAEFLLIRTDFENPISIAIDSITHSTILQYDMKDPMCINLLYEDLSPLSALWETLKPHLHGIKTVYIAPSNNTMDGNSNYCAINYGAIIIDNGNYRASDKYVVSHVSSTAEISDAKKRRQTYKDALIYGGINYNSSEECDNYINMDNNGISQISSDNSELRGGIFNYLSGTKREAYQTDSILHSHNVSTRVLIGERATEKTFWGIDKKSPSIIHIASHSFLIPFEPDGQDDTASITNTNFDNNSQYKASLANTGLLLSAANTKWLGKKTLPNAEDGILTSQEIANLDLTDTELVVLSTCESGLGDTNNLSGTIYGLHHAFRIAGVGHIVSSLWKVDDQATQLFMKYFYTHLMNGKQIHEAMKSAQLDLISFGYKDPYYWASFIILS